MIGASGMARDAAQARARAGFVAAHQSLFADGRWGTLQRNPLRIAHLDVVSPFPLPTHPRVPIPGDSGAFATASGLEDQ